jgi:hypothetical protein
MNLDLSYGDLEAIAVEKGLQRRLLILSIVHALLLQYFKFLDSIETRFLSFAEMHAPCRTTLSATLVQTVSDDSHFWCQLIRIISQFISEAGTLIEASSLGEKAQPSLDLIELLLEIKTIKDQVNTRADRISNQLQSFVKFFGDYARYPNSLGPQDD